MAFFFFGTLMDRDVLARVLDREVAPDALQPAWLDGYRRVKAAAASYPVLRASPTGRVAGRLLSEVSARDARRIAHFEEDEYEPAWLPVRVAGGGTRRARVFVAVSGVLGCTDEPWELMDWAARHKEAYLVQCTAWMRDCPC